MGDLTSKHTSRPEKRVVIGLGTGRCGTTSLAQLLSRQQDAYVTHERIPILPWLAQPGVVEGRIERLLAEPFSLCGDVGFYYLPYAQALLDRFPTVRMICLQRERRATVSSYLRSTEGRNHWVEHDGSIWKPDPIWDGCYPSYNEPSKADAIGRYWDEYYYEAERLQAKYPDSFRVWPTQALNRKGGVDEILEFVGIPANRRTYVHIKANASARSQWRIPHARDVVDRAYRMHLKLVGKWYAYHEIPSGPQIFPKPQTRTRTQVQGSRKLAVLVPYRHRADHLEKFAPFLHKFLTRQKVPFRIFVIEQADNDSPFNRGKLLNVGYLLTRDDFQYSCMHDVDMLPTEKINYRYAENPVHLVRNVPYLNFFGGVTLFPNEIFARIDGYDTNYWGWGCEDDDLFYRCKLHDIQPWRANRGTFRLLPHTDSIDLAPNGVFCKDIRFRDQLRRLHDESCARLRRLQQALVRRDSNLNLDGASNTRFSLLETTNTGLFTHFLVDIREPGCPSFARIRQEPNATLIDSYGPSG